MRKFVMSHIAYAEVRLLSRSAYDAIFRKGDVFEVMNSQGNLSSITVK